MNDYKKVYEDAVKVHDMVERVKKSRKAALDNIDSDWAYLDPDEKEFVKNAIIAAYEPRIDNLLKEFCTVYEENKGDRKLRLRIFDENVELAENDILEADRVCSSGPCCFQNCPLHGYGHCWIILSKYKRYEFEEVDE